jgi:hypothetical protein
VNEGEDKGRTEMQKVTMFFPFHGVRTADETKLFPFVRLHLHLCLNWHPRRPLPHLITPHVLPSLVPLVFIAPAFHPLRFLNMAWWWADKMGEQGEQDKVRIDE